MKLWNSYCREMKTASRGFYFYVEIAVAVIILAVLLMVVSKEDTGRVKEVVFCDIMSEEAFEELMSRVDRKGHHERVEDQEFRLKPVTIRYTDDSGKVILKEYKDKKKIVLRQYQYYDFLTGKHTKTKFFAENFDDMLRVAWDKKYTGTKMRYGEDRKDYYINILFGYETDKYRNLVQAAHRTVDVGRITDQMAEEENRLFILQLSLWLTAGGLFFFFLSLARYRKVLKRQGNRFN